MDPKVKVKEQNVDDNRSLVVKAVKSSPMHNLCSSARMNKNISTSPATKMAGTRPLNSTLHREFDSTATNKDRKNEDDDGEVTKTCSRANLVLPPRAVLSSPDNDEMIGKMNKFNRRTFINEKQELKRKLHSVSMVKPASPLRKKTSSRETTDITSSPGLKKRIQPAGLRKISFMSEVKQNP